MGPAEPGAMQCSKSGSPSITLAVRPAMGSLGGGQARLGGLEIEKQLDPCALLSRSLGGFFAPGNPTPSAAARPDAREGQLRFHLMHYI